MAFIEIIFIILPLFLNIYNVHIMNFLVLSNYLPQMSMEILAMPLGVKQNHLLILAKCS